MPPSAPSGSTEVAVIDASAQIGFSSAELAIEALIAAAQNRNLIATPYFNPPNASRTLLKSAIDRGVEVDLLLAGPHTDKRICDVVAETHFAELVDHGARVWRYQPTMMHVKALLVDGAMALVGSVNVNRRSVEKDEEVAIAVHDTATTELLESHFRQDGGDSELVTPPFDETSIARSVAAALLRPLRAEM